MTTISIDRHEQLQKLDDFIVNSRKKLSSIVSRLGWTVESVSKDVKNIVVCPFNESHHIPEQSSCKHLHDCQWKAEGYGKHDLPLSVPSLPPGAPSSIKFDEQLQDDVIRNAKQKNPSMLLGAVGRLIPRTSDRLIVEFTRDERCALYDYVIANTVEPDLGDDIADMNKPKSSFSGKKSSYLELIAQERNLKRRRAKYRGVHTNKKSQIEILREVVNQQMEMLAEYIAEKRDEVPNESTDYPSNDDLSRIRTDHEESAKKRQCDRSRNDRTPADNNFSTENYDAPFHERSSKRSEISISRSRSSFDDRHERRNNVTNYADRRKEGTMEMEISSRERPRSVRREKRDSSERRYRKSSHKRQRHKSKNRHERTTSSRDGEKSRSSRDSKYDERISGSTRNSRCDDRGRKRSKESQSTGR